jgi:hypothetical protein
VKKILINKEYYEVTDFFKVDLRISEKDVIMLLYKNEGYLK